MLFIPYQLVAIKLLERREQAYTRQHRLEGVRVGNVRLDTLTERSRVRAGTGLESNWPPAQPWKRHPIQRFGECQAIDPRRPQPLEGLGSAAPDRKVRAFDQAGTRID